ncbi:hypothetical protein Aph01nite_35580 [Acrocarpospora phusangensis]|uniref:Zinc finger CGNR domain-containing protein n=1 Tax=Acrocarpospora phusangensis TaxID=1070424 RepID=A0A919UPD0_9ACTN|nr:ABATE domain-containing protein [Acrocarpospora phusangensis]GIH25248.1 hypothetical protein Aph01nite_35580 [Acrocarpospora phusangensis]
MTSGEVTTSATLLGEPLPIELMNTYGMVRGEPHDAVSDNAAMAAWLRAVEGRIRSEAGGTADSLVWDEAAVRPIATRLRNLRDALRLLAAEATGVSWPPAASSVITTRRDALDAMNALAPAWPELVWPAGEQPARMLRTPGTPGELALFLIAHQGVELFASPSRERLRACRAPGCLLFFLKEHPRREWCSPICGNRARVARHYHRHHTSPRPEPE